MDQPSQVLLKGWGRWMWIWVTDLWYSLRNTTVSFEEHRASQIFRWILKWTWNWGEHSHCAQVAAILSHIEHRIVSVFTGLHQWSLPGIHAHSNDDKFSIPMEDIGKDGQGGREREGRGERRRGRKKERKEEREKEIAQMPTEARRRVVSSGVGITDSCEPPYVGAGSWSWIFWRSRKHS